MHGWAGVLRGGHGGSGLRRLLWPPISPRALRGVEARRQPHDSLQSLVLLAHPRRTAATGRGPPRLSSISATAMAPSSAWTRRPSAVLLPSAAAAAFRFFAIGGSSAVWSVSRQARNRTSPSRVWRPGAASGCGGSGCGARRRTEPSETRAGMAAVSRCVRVIWACRVRRAAADQVGVAAGLRLSAGSGAGEPPADPLWHRGVEHPGSWPTSWCS